MIEPPEIIRLSETRTALIPISAPQADIRHVMGAGIRELIDVLSAQQVQPAGSDSRITCTGHRHSVTSRSAFRWRAQSRQQAG